MYTILKKEALNPTVTRMDIAAPLIARKAEPGQFVILRVDEAGERIPLTVADTDPEAGSVTIIFQIVGATTYKLNQLQVGDSLHDFVGPLGVASHVEGLKKVAVIGGGVGSAIAYPIAKKLHALGATVHTIVGFRSKDLVILEDEFRACSDLFKVMTDDGSYGEKGLVTNALEALLQAGETYDEVIAIGRILTATRWTLTRPSSARTCTKTLSATSTKKPAICSRGCDRHAEYEPEEESHARAGTRRARAQL